MGCTLFRGNVRVALLSDLRGAGSTVRVANEGQNRLPGGRLHPCASCDSNSASAHKRVVRTRFRIALGQVGVDRAAVREEVQSERQGGQRAHCGRVRCVVVPTCARSVRRFRQEVHAGLDAWTPPASRAVRERERVLTWRRLVVGRTSLTERLESQQCDCEQHSTVHSYNCPSSRVAVSFSPLEKTSCFQGQKVRRHPRPCA